MLQPWPLCSSITQVNCLLEFLALRPNLGRALRVGVAFLLPLLICHAMGMRGDAVFIAMAAQSIALPDLRGAYGMRLLILATMTLAEAGSAVLGVWAGSSVIAATLSMGFLALVGVLWRHLSADYGPALSVSSALLFLLGLSQPGSLVEGLHFAQLVMIGGAVAALLHIIAWPFRPQHPLRYAVAETWVAASDLINTMRPALDDAKPSRASSLSEKERILREALDRTFVILSAAKGRQSESLLRHLEGMRVEVVHLVMRLLALHGTLEPLLDQPQFAHHLPTVDSVLKALSDAARSVAITLITHQPGNFGTTEIRLRRCLHLIQVLNAQLGDEGANTHAGATLGSVAEELTRLRKVLAETVDHGSVKSSFAGRLPELGRQPMKALAAWINPTSQIDPVLMRYGLRMAVLTMLSVAVYKGFDIPRGYWIAFTVVVILQPDYGSTRQRAGERIMGTLFGALLGSLLLAIPMPLYLLDICAGMMAFAFAYCLKQRYDAAVFFVTLMLVLITETLSVVHLDFPLTRVLCTLAGGALALTSALFFWPIWEGEKFTTLLAAAIRANSDYLRSIGLFIREAPHDLDLLMVKRKAENANRFAAASLQRLLAEPAHSEEHAARASALITYNQRLARALTAMAVHLPLTPSAQETALLPTIEQVTRSIESLAVAAGQEPTHAVITNFAPCLATCTTPLRTQLAKAITEVRAMALAMHLEESAENKRPMRKKSNTADAMG
ncbi:MAG: hypothetical protein JWO89_2491 [Verrucomicrobiaceae bacterium]|nr:hypothetical protein [Verrucomicrobiaceae bacterium]